MLQKAGETKNTTIEAEGLERIQLAVMASYDNRGINTTSLAENLSKINGLTDTNNQAITKDTAITLPTVINLNDINYTIKQDGNVIKLHYITSGLKCDLNAKDLRTDSIEWQDRTTGKKFLFSGITINNDVKEKGLYINPNPTGQKVYYLSPAVDNYSPLTLEFYGKLLEPTGGAYSLILTTKDNVAHQANICYGDSSMAQNLRGIYTDMWANDKINTSQYLSFPCDKHIIITYNNNIVKIYSDGELIRTGSISSMPIGDAVMLGGWYSSNGGKPNAYYKIVRIYNRELNQNEIEQNFLYNKKEWND